MKSVVILYIAWLIAAGMLTVAVIGPPAINFGYTPRAYSYTGRGSRSHSYARSYYSQRKDFYTLLRWVCCASFAYSAIAAFQMKRIAWTWIFAVLAVLFKQLA